MALGFVLLACDPADPSDPCCDAGPADAGQAVDGGSPPTTDAGCACPEFDPFAALADPNLPARRLPGRMRLASSREPVSHDAKANRDWNNFVRRDGTELVVLEEEGPGVITRVWFTIRDPAEEHEAGDTLPLHLYVDDEEIVFHEGRRGTTLAELSSGEHPAFPHPWAAGRGMASNAFILAVPIAFSESVRMTLENDREDLVVYYQIDWRELPEETVVRSFDGHLTEAEAAALQAASALWADGEGATDEERIDREIALASGEETVVEVTGPTVVRSLGAAGDPTFEAITTRLEIDGATQGEGPLSRLTFATAPTRPHTSAGSRFDGTTAELRYPIPVTESLRWRVRNDGDAPVSVSLAATHEPSGWEPSLGRFRVECATGHSGSDPINLLELDGQAGQYAGQFLVMRGPEAGWWMMEGDHQVNVDGEWMLLGTGTEDYIGGAFYYIGGPFSLPTSGATGFEYDEGHLTSAEVDVSMYRHHLLDTVPFESSFVFQYESYVAGTEYERCMIWYGFESSP